MSYAVIAFMAIVGVICIATGGAYWFYFRHVLPEPDLLGFIDNRSDEQRYRDQGLV